MATSAHTCDPDREAILADDCSGCDENAASPMVLRSDPNRMATLWDWMIQVEHPPAGAGAPGYRSQNEKKACQQLYYAAIWLERFVGCYPWRPFDLLQLDLGIPEGRFLMDGLGVGSIAELHGLMEEGRMIRLGVNVVFENVVDLSDEAPCLAFVEVERDDGSSFMAGDWRTDERGYRVLRIQAT